jgi:nucleotide-binding universal stress UspA family protein
LADGVDVGTGFVAALAFPIGADAVGRGLLCAPGGDDPFGLPVLPLDLSKETREKVNKAIELSRQFDATIHVVSILLTDDEDVVKKLKLQLNQVKKFLEKAKVKSTAELVTATKKDSDLSDEVLEYSKKVKGDLLMIMTQQELDFSERFIGSAAQELINESEIPVCSIIPSVKRNTTVFKPY